MRDDAKQALDQHQLTSVMHLVFLDAQQHLEASLLRRPHGRGERYGFGENLRRQALHHRREFVTTPLESLEDLILGRERLFFGCHFWRPGAEVGEVDPGYALCMRLD